MTNFTFVNNGSTNGMFRAEFAGGFGTESGSYSLRDVDAPAWSAGFTEIKANGLEVIRSLGWFYTAESAAAEIVAHSTRSASERAAVGYVLAEQY